MPTRPTRDLFTELLFYSVLIGMAYLTMLIIWPFLAPLAWAAILAMTLRPVHLRFCIHLRKSNAALATTLLAGLLIITPAVFLGAIIAQQTPAALAYVNGLSDTTPEQILLFWATLRERLPVPLPPDPMSLIVESARTAASYLVGGAGSIVANVLSTLASLLVMLFALFFFLRDGKVFGSVIRQLLPFSEPERERLLHEASELVVASVGAGLTVAFVQGVIGGLSFWVVQLPAPAVWGGAIAICSLLPVVGSTIIWVPVTAWLFFSGDIGRAALMAGLCGVLLSSVDNVLRPILLAGRTSASGLVVFIGLLGGVSAFGFVGIVLGPIVLVITGTLIDAMTRHVHADNTIAVVE
ncbi:MAG: AI-2E family transporter [Acidobacteria bacterium]|nr:AI-2E family transporter [Acidobacteriota bacterium]